VGEGEGEGLFYDPTPQILLLSSERAFLGRKNKKDGRRLELPASRCSSMADPLLGLSFVYLVKLPSMFVKKKICTF